jgi:hypothetical protein
MTSAGFALVSAIFGAAGTICLFLGTYSMEPYRMPFYVPREAALKDDGTLGRNGRRLVLLRIGLTLLLVSFILQGLGPFV